MDNIKKNANMFRKIATQISDATGICYDDVCAVLAIVPRIDVQEVKHAEWKINCDGYYPYCSNCKQEPPRREMSQYCPHCGCRMDGDENGII